MIAKYFLKTYCFQYFLTHPLAILNLKFCSYSFTLRNMSAKSTNILIYTGYTCDTLFKEIYNNLQKCLRDDRYTIYHLLESEINEQPWMENSILLIISSEIIKNNIAEAFETYFKKYGNILLICSKFNNYFIESKCLEVSENKSFIPLTFKEIEDVILYRGKYSYETHGTVLCYDTFKKPLLHKVIKNENMFICSDIYLDRDPIFLTLPSNYSNEKRLSILKCLLSEEFGLEVKSKHFTPELTFGISISKIEFESTKLSNQAEFCKPSKIPAFREVTLNYFDKIIQLPIYLYKNSLPFTFNTDVYYSKLDSNVYGHQLVYFPVITSTMDVVKQFSEHEGIVIIADIQICGKGRRSNKWISPKGCAMFSLHFTVNLCSQLGKKMSLLQHISALAVVHGIRSQPVYKDLTLRIKWPNDIYYNKIKLGGLLVTSVIQNDMAHVYIGWGINVENSYPTACLNDIIDKYNSENSTSLPHLCKEEVVACTLSKMEYFVRSFIEYGSEELFALYYSYWMHGDQEVTLKNLNKQGTVIGLDDYGFLKVKSNKGEILTLQPDGNRFDIMENLIYSI